MPNNSHARWLVAQARERHRRPDRRVRVLPAVLSHAREVAFDVPRVQIALVERRIQQLHQPAIPPNQVLIQRLHRDPRAFRVARAGEHAPALRDRIDLAFRVRGRPQRRAVIEVRAAVPAAIPGIALDVGAQLRRLLAAAFGKLRIAARVRQDREFLAAPRTGRIPARRFRPCRGCPPGSCRRSNRPNPSAASRAPRTAGRAGWLACSGRTGWPSLRNAPAGRSRNPLRRSPAVLPGSARFRRALRYRRCSTT